MIVVGFASWILLKASPPSPLLLKMISSPPLPTRFLIHAHPSPPPSLLQAPPWKAQTKERIALSSPPPPPPPSLSPRLAKKLGVSHRRLGECFCSCRASGEAGPLAADELKGKEKKDLGGSNGEETIQCSAMLKQEIPTWSLVQHVGMAHKEGGGDKRQEEEEEEQGLSKKLVFFDVETTVPTRTGQGYQLLEFAAVVLDTRGLGELLSYHTLVRPKDPSCVGRRTTECNGITPHAVAHAPAFADVAHDIYSILHGHIWAGHNILKFDNLRIQEAFSEIGHPSPQPSGIVDTYPLLKKTFGKRAGNYKLESLANYCGYGKQEHRSLADVRMNVDVLRSCATLMFLESNFPHIFPVQQSESPVSRSTSRQSGILCRSAVKCKGELPASSANENVVETENASSSSLNNTTGRVHHSRNKQHQLSCTSTDVLASEKDVNAVSASSCHDKSTGEEILKRTLGEMNVKEGDAQTVHATSDMVLTAKTSSEGGDSSLPEALLREDLENHIARTEHYLAVCDAYEADLSEDLEKYLTVEDRAKNDLSHHGATRQGTLIKPNDSEIDAFISGTLQKDGIVDNDTANDEQGEASMARDECPPFVFPGSIELASVEVSEQPSSLGCKKILSYKGYPLQLMEFKAKIRFTVNPLYALDEKGRPRFSVLMEPSKEALEVIRKCEDLVQRVISSESRGIEWLPVLRNDTGAWAARMSIGTKGIGSSATYTTKFYRSAFDGLREISIDPVNAVAFKDVIPHGSIINVGFGFYTFHVNNRAGVRLIAKHITIL